MNPYQWQLDLFTQAGIKVDIQDNPNHWQLNYGGTLDNPFIIIDYWPGPGTVSAFATVFRMTYEGKPQPAKLILLIKENQIALTAKKVKERIELERDCQHCGKRMYKMKSINKVHPDKSGTWMWVEATGLSHWFHCPNRPPKPE